MKLCKNHIRGQSFCIRSFNRQSFFFFENLSQYIFWHMSSPIFMLKCVIGLAPIFYPEHDHLTGLEKELQMAIFCS